MATALAVLVVVVVVVVDTCLAVVVLLGSGQFCPVVFSGGLFLADPVADSRMRMCLLWLLRWLWLSSWSTHALPWWCCWGLANFAHGRDKRFYQFQIETECDGKRGGIGGVISRPVWDQQRNKMLWQTRGIRRRNFQPVSDIQC